MERRVKKLECEVRDLRERFGKLIDLIVEYLDLELRLNEPPEKGGETDDD